MSLKSLLLKHVIATAAGAAAAKLDGDPKTNAKDHLKASLLGLTENDELKDEALDQLVDAVITAKHFGEDEEKAEGHLKAVVENLTALFELAQKH